MKLSVSNIAWAPEQTEEAYKILESMGVTGLEVAPGILFGESSHDPFGEGQKACDTARARAEAHGLELTSMQSLLYGVEGAGLFNSAEARARLIAGIEDAIALAGRLKVPNLVFGSPKNRTIPDGMDADAAREIWRKTFRRLGDKAHARGCVIALEPNPVEYETNFMTTLDETLSVARNVDHRAIRVNLDLGALILTGEIDEIDGRLADNKDMFSHVHLSAPHLAPLATEAEFVSKFLEVLDRHEITTWTSIEMRRGLEAVPAAIRACQR